MVDHILTNATVHAPEAGGSAPTAVAIRGDRIVAVGSDDDVRGLVCLLYTSDAADEELAEPDAL